MVIALFDSEVTPGPVVADQRLRYRGEQGLQQGRVRGRDRREADRGLRNGVAHRMALKREKAESAFLFRRE